MQNAPRLGASLFRDEDSSVEFEISCKRRFVLRMLCHYQHAHPGGCRHVLLHEIQVSPHGLLFVQRLQHPTLGAEVGALTMMRVGVATILSTGVAVRTRAFVMVALGLIVADLSVGVSVRVAAIAGVLVLVHVAVGVSVETNWVAFVSGSRGGD